MRQLIRRIKTLLGIRPTVYVVVYDIEHPHLETQETYYGYFSSIKEAREMYSRLRGDNPLYCAARICKVVEYI